jgi:hypothetical protein
VRGQQLGKPADVHERPAKIVRDGVREALHLGVSREQLRRVLIGGRRNVERGRFCVGAHGGREVCAGAMARAAIDTETGRLTGLE